ncbi:hypothetical protein OG21DRAFT_1527298 [Imleria badia]|nr:hypothetical protein OG21DRAFT_1527298 [Imleria badia]
MTRDSKFLQGGHEAGWWGDYMMGGDEIVAKEVWRMDGCKTRGSNLAQWAQILQNECDASGWWVVGGLQVGVAGGLGRVKGGIPRCEALGLGNGKAPYTCRSNCTTGTIVHVVWLLLHARGQWEGVRLGEEEVWLSQSMQRDGIVVFVRRLRRNVACCRVTRHVTTWHDIVLFIRPTGKTHHGYKGKAGSSELSSPSSPFHGVVKSLSRQFAVVIAIVVNVRGKTHRSRCGLGRTTRYGGRTPRQLRMSRRLPGILRAHDIRHAESRKPEYEGGNCEDCAKNVNDESI